MIESHCPSRETLEQLMLGKLRGPQAEALEDHLLSCDSCSQAMDTHELNDPVLAALSNPDPFQGDEDYIQAAIERAKTLTTEDVSTPTLQETVAFGQESTDAVSATPNREELDFLAPPKQADEIGRLGNYRVLEVLGIGGMGVVFRAEDLQLKRQVALKVMKPEVAANHDAKQRFLTEAQATAAIEHDHIVTIHQVGEDAGVPFIAMRYLKGESLQSRLKREKKLPPEDVVRIGRQIASGLAAAHQRGLIHRDIKPDNIRLEANTGRVKIVDFGLVRNTAADVELTQTGVVMGTPKYMSPEQAEGRPVDHRSDLFSLGSVLYNLASGNAPFEAENVNATLVAVARDPAVPIQDVNPELDPCLCELVMQLLEKDREQRPPSAEEVAGRLEDIQENVASTAKSPESTVAYSGGRSEGESAGGGNDRNALQRGFSGEAADTSWNGIMKTVVILAIILGLSSLVYLAISSNFKIETPHGTLVIQIDSDKYVTSVQRKIVTIKNIETNEEFKIALDGKETTKGDLEPGSYKFALETDSGLKTLTDRFEISQDGKTVVQVSAAPAMIGDAQDVASNENPRQSAKSASGKQNAETADSRGENWALEFDGKDDHVVVSDFDLTSKKPLTIELLLTANSLPTRTRTIIETGYFLNLYSLSRIYGAQMILQERKSVDRKSKVAPALYVKRHVAGVFDGSTLQLFVDGVRQDNDLVWWTGEKEVKIAEPIDPVETNSLSRVIIGGSGPEYPTPKFFHGIIDEVRISNVARYTKDYTPEKRFSKDEHTLALYHFDEGVGDVSKDSSGNNHHGKIIGAKWVRVDDELKVIASTNGSQKD
jgi:serine/threonine protein kinase